MCPTRFFGGAVLEERGSAVAPWGIQAVAVREGSGRRTHVIRLRDSRTVAVNPPKGSPGLGGSL